MRLETKEEKATRRHVIPALRDYAVHPCIEWNCGSVCLCGPCHARKALETLDPTWRP
jgi:ferredoxin